MRRQNASSTLLAIEDGTPPNPEDAENEDEEPDEDLLPPVDLASPEADPPEEPEEEEQDGENEGSRQEDAQPPEDEADEHPRVPALNEERSREVEREPRMSSADEHAPPPIGTSSSPARSAASLSTTASSRDHETMAVHSLNLQTHPCQSLDAVICMTCGTEVLPKKARLRSKSANAEKWECNVCNSLTVMLSSINGGWPTDKFKELTDEQKLSFFQNIRGITKKADLAEFTENTFAKISVREKQFYDGGKFLPLGAWGAKGFNVENIRTKSAKADVQEHPVLGTVYRVSIIQSGTMHREGYRREQKVCSTSGEKRLRDNSEESERTKKAKAQRKLKKDAEKAKKQRKLDEKNEKDQAAAMKKARTTAEAIVLKLTDISGDMKKNLSHALMKDVPDAVATDARAMSEKLQSIINRAELVSTNPSRNKLDEADTLANIHILLKEAKKQNQIVKTLLTSFTRVGRIIA